MGLDNGIYLEKNEKVLPFWVRPTSISHYEENGVELCYWRKCYGIRSRILEAIPEGSEIEIGVYELTPHSVKEIRKILKYFSKKENWERYAHSSIWDYKEMIKHLRIQRINLIWLEHYLKKNPNASCYFYDSY